MTQLQEAMTAGVFVEFQDAAGQCCARAVFEGWQGRPVPTVGDAVLMPATLVACGSRRKLSGQVTARRFEVQLEADGQPVVWVRLEVALTAGSWPGRRVPTAGAEFSQN